jgi:hypothetical protein
MNVHEKPSGRYSHFPKCLTINGEKWSHVTMGDSVFVRPPKLNVTFEIEYADVTNRLPPARNIPPATDEQVVSYIKNKLVDHKVVK